MSWTRSAALRAGATGAAGTALVLSALAPAGGASPTTHTAAASVQTFALAAADLPVPAPLTAQDVAAAEAARDELRASRSQERAALVAAENRAERRQQRVAEMRAEQRREARAEQRTSRTQSRAAAPSAVVGERYTTVALNVRTAPGGAVLTTLDRGSRVAITNRTDGSWQQIRHQGRDAWVSGQYLSAQQPAPASSPAPSGPSSAACPHGSGIEGGLTANARAVYRAVCARWPQITGYGGYRPSADYHGSGRAVDVMVSGPLGWDVANWLRANAGALGVSELIYSQRIWTVQRSGEGWRWMSDRGSTTANHYDHVHVSVY